MDNKLRKMKRAKNQPGFPGLIFTDNLRDRIATAIHNERESDEEVIMSIFQLLSSKKTGVVLLDQLRGRGVKRFEKNEGILYMFLHRLEKQNQIIGEWTPEGSKEYILASSGKKILQKAEKGNVKAFGSIQEVLKGAYTQ
ncbi:helix-turn-helix transcriptional regulator [Cytobacillus purgationiresistens]|uniref:DNA-binding PadR family transcriptional regulator n=1 Tax=Cytobacillus purgationiresistens TaxID=863449 RepID=A0ABU0APR0_9BACI|nr:helix-turn-helix transcriptional regulator [Cytobacillus purgationiresistens]MDQ0273188.1 DNA-binding PadR family transcriptional regulator [Cytobacillus purgationiresistens]